MSTMNKKLAGENLIEFINFYREQECLWNIYSKNYKNIFLKNKAYNLMAKKFKIGPQEVKTKINNLRSNFNREFKKCEDSKRSGAGVEDIYVPQIYWYDEMLFLKDCITPRASVSNF
ncbi:uncharacterized protein LOC129614366 [Condylostylus longicornis]|uniref:uncharacterized protein LOC129614366 n=1 Tax=Condylostylus longicornis TaxID=2530218 RepID=UPI00244E475D|nr:uncharacterized protein LOC129614366 [Condylostylus longicornis]